MASEQAVSQTTPEPVRFRPSKKRRTGYRQRTDQDDDDRQDDGSNTTTTQGPTTQPRATAADYFDGDADTPEPAVVKARSAHRARLRGVGFRAGSRPGDVETTTGHALVLRDEQQDGATPVPGLSDRFTHQTGLLGELNDKHMFVSPLPCPAPPRRLASGTPLIIQGPNT